MLLEESPGWAVLLEGISSQPVWEPLPGLGQQGATNALSLGSRPHKKLVDQIVSQR
jgi:hypothetical protein